jgi:putative phosphoribosyl transferase
VVAAAKWHGSGAGRAALVRPVPPGRDPGGASRSSHIRNQPHDVTQPSEADMTFHDRADAGRALAQRLRHFKGLDVVVLGLPRGGVPVAFEVATALAAPLDVIVVRKLAHPMQPELAIGALGEGGTRVLNPDVLRTERIGADELANIERDARVEMDRQVARVRHGRLAVRLADRVAVIVDDGVATGSTARTACQIARAQGAARVVLAVPVASPRALARLADVADEVVCVDTPEWFYAVGEWYDDFTPTTDEEVLALLDRAAASEFHDHRRRPRRGFPGSTTASMRLRSSGPA